MGEDFNENFADVRLSAQEMADISKRIALAIAETERLLTETRKTNDEKRAF